MCSTCTHPTAATVTLYDGSTACSYCDRWRAECDARRVLRLPTEAARRAELADIAKKRGATGATELRALMVRIYRHERDKKATP